MALQFRRGTDAEWEAGKQNIVAGEPAIALDTQRVFVGTANGQYVELANKDSVDPIADRMGLRVITDYTIGERAKVVDGVVTTESAPAYKYAKISCAEGDKFTMSIDYAIVSNFFFADINDNAIPVQASGTDNVVLTAPANAAYVYINNKVENSYTDYYGDWSETVLERLENPYIPINSITTEKIVDEAVTTNKLADSSVTTAKLNGVIDNTLAVSGKAADSKAVGDALAEKADTNGSYDEMTVGDAKQLLSNVYETESAPYIFRASGGSLEIGDREQDTLVGLDLVWNQLAKLNVDGWTFNTGVVSMSIADDEITLSSVVGTTSVKLAKIKEITIGHKYLLSGSSKVVDATSARFGLFSSNNSALKLALDGTTTSYVYGATIVSPSDGDFIALRIPNASTQGQSAKYKNLQCIDLTAMFGSTIADYIYSLETGTAGAGVAWVKRYLTKDYYPYSAPTMQNGVASSHEMVGFNQWDEEWEVGTYGNSGGKLVKATLANVIRCKNPIKVLPNTTYRFECVNPNYNNGLYIWEAESVNATITKSASAQSGRTIDFTTSESAINVFIASRPGYGETYKNDLCFHLKYDGERDGEYEPYVKHSYLLDDTVDLHGIPMKDESGNLYADGDTYEADGTVTRRYIVVDLGDLSWGYGQTGSAGYYFFNANLSGLTDMPLYRGNGICSKFLRETSYPGTWEHPDNTYFIGNSSAIPVLYVRCDAYNDATTFKNAMSGVKLVTELATPTTESAEPFQTPQIVDNWGTEEYVTEGVIPIGHSTKYPVNLRSKIEVEPNSPTSDGVYLMQRENGVNTYVPYISDVPVLPSENGTYSLKVTVSGSTKTVSWVSD